MLYRGISAPSRALITHLVYLILGRHTDGVQKKVELLLKSMTK
ncbi:hypothetical protein YpB42003004_1908 [Yersinia pestis biovar Antiqua str. B42003004]|uniref:Uncharacterized protein n=1 Tax=Yersinia pestis biovar Orientalis str. IP275 TaxID=373665 RepID=A0AAV3BCA1_YERPE|nr:hypothetical protein YPIP275_0545 [Yersinia pestis biovar Orientalis str. IP275]EDR39673.1 hypothetical protein YpF1991016_1651 [Yersinia pestis biovar Orientalis str. F1991016]EDR52223.1 hypothetical protein YpB42003004_1908 [Yersinia pestis biovar Antiqua str. B42003004]EDR55512.1 hypothetical protein YpMG051020_3067 [Yersinia pestis biovar Orientalis str. MG05-1020]EDR60238.1 hypothetical protein YpUG050454_3085 [Yersinia pestis biovar Antiqua str. UG05-0454]EIQ91097.1 hypothetical prote